MLVVDTVLLLRLAILRVKNEKCSNQTAYRNTFNLAHSSSQLLYWHYTLHLLQVLLTCNRFINGHLIRHDDVIDVVINYVYLLIDTLRKFTYDDFKVYLYV